MCKLSSYLVACVAVNYVDNFGVFNGELFGYSTRTSSLAFSVFFGGAPVAPYLDTLSDVTVQNYG